MLDNTRFDFERLMSWHPQNTTVALFKIRKISKKTVKFTVVIELKQNTYTQTNRLLRNFCFKDVSTNFGKCCWSLHVLEKVTMLT